MHFFTDELTCLRAGGFTLSLVAPRAFESFFLWHCCLLSTIGSKHTCTSPQLLAKIMLKTGCFQDLRSDAGPWLAIGGPGFQILFPRYPVMFWPPFFDRTR